VGALGARPSRESVGLCLGSFVDRAPFFLGCDVISDCFLICSPNERRWFCLAKERILTFVCRAARFQGVLQGISGGLEDWKMRSCRPRLSDWLVDS